MALTDAFCCGNQKNIGFDVRGDVKVFDFGLCKDLDPRLKNKDGDGYRLTGRAGSLPYSEYRDVIFYLHRILPLTKLLHFCFFFS